MRSLSRLILFIACAITAGCKLVIVVPEGGSVTTESGGYSCAEATECELEIVDAFFDETFLARIGTEDSNATKSLPFTAEQGALLGCGPSFASACGSNDRNQVFSDNFDTDEDGSVEETLRLLSLKTDLPGGVDFMNADGSVLSQEFTMLKAASQPLKNFKTAAGGAITASDREALIATPSTRPGRCVARRGRDRTVPLFA